jgi:RNA polymerase sigma-70 factor (ECF subfamily)
MDNACESQTSATLLGRLKDLGDAQAWKEFVHRYAPRIYRWCRGFGLQDADAQDITQGILVKLAVRLRTFEYDPGGSFRGYLKTVTIRAWRDFVESRQHNGQACGGDQLQSWWEFVEAGDDLAQQLDEEFQRELLSEALARVQLRVDSRTWEVFRLLVFEEQPGTDVARQFRMSLSAVYGIRHRVQAMLREEVRKLEPPDAS